MKSRFLKSLLFGGAVLGGLAVGFLGVKCIRIVPEGHVAVVYSMNGGVKDEIKQQGLQIVSPFERTKNFTVAQEQLILSEDKREGSEEAEGFSVSTRDNANVKISFQMSYRFLEDKVSDTYNNFKGMDGDAIINSRVRTVLKSKISEITAKHTMMDIYSGNREKINNELPAHLTKALSDYGIEVISASIIDVHPDKKLQESIDSKVKAIQDKERAEIEKQKAQIEAEKKKIEAEGDAKAEIEKAKGIAEANKLISDSLTDRMLKDKEMDARLKHGWIKTQGATGVIVDDRDKK